MDEIIDDILAAASVYNADGVPKASVFCLGPYARRVSFVSQQYRALNLVWALHARTHVKVGDSIAVVGAGLAGVTAAAALIAIGCNVKLFDTGTGVMPRQRHTAHRIVHPTINRWPLRPLNPTTEFPFIEWYGAECQTIVEVVEQQWRQFATDANEAWGVEVLKIKDRIMGGVRLETSDPSMDREYDLAILAVGFGAEKRTEGFEPIDYWIDDGIEAFRTMNPKSKFIVSGCGDGGLIDALRVVHFDFDKGNLTLDVANALNDTPISKKIKIAEEDRQKTIQTLGDCYIDCAKSLIKNRRYKEINDKLVKSIEKARSTVVLLGKRYSHPCSLNAAPIHKLLVAHAWASDAIEFVSGKDVKRESDSIVVGEESFPSSTKVTIRHGAEANFKHLLSMSEQTRLRDAQAPLAEQQAMPRWPEGLNFPVPKTFPQYNPRSKEFIDHRKNMAEDVLTTLDKTARLETVSGGFIVIYRPQSGARFPDKFFGIPCRAELISEENAHF